jgi:hypothetical protein
MYSGSKETLAAFTGDTDKHYTVFRITQLSLWRTWEALFLDSPQNSGNLTDLVKLLSIYEPVLREHFRRIHENKIRDHYISHEIQNELIERMASNVKETILNTVKRIKYFAILLDCTRDAGRVEQMAIILRYVNTEKGCIEEHFVGFMAVQETAAATFPDTILRQLQSLGLDIINYCRGQGYDNDTDGVNSGVKTKILAINPRAFFTACGCHNWNLLLGDAAKSSRMAISFFLA